MAQTLIYAGTRITAALLNSIAPLQAVRGSTQSVTSSTTLVNDDTLFLALAANAIYDIEMTLNFTGGTLGSSDLKWAFTVPSGASGAGEVSHLLPTNVHANQYTSLTNASNSSNQSATNGTAAQATKMSANVITTSAGTLQLQWAQVTSSGTATVMGVGSQLLAWRLQ